MRRLRAAMIGAAVLGALLIPTTAAASESTPWIRVDRVLVDRLGGVSVQGTHSCSYLYDALRTAEGVVVWDETPQGPQPRTLTAGPDDRVVIGSNPDNFVVSQPSGRKQMITVEHGSSRLQWCFTTDLDIFADQGWTLPCEPYGPCRWVTDRYGYSRTDPLFVYASTGKFKTGSMNVSVTDAGYWIEVYDADGNRLDSGMVFEETFNSQVVRAVGYR